MLIRTNRLRAILLALLVMILTMPAACIAEAAEVTVRVGWHESPFNLTDPYGRKTGYSYEYQRKIAAYTGWKYEYVEGSWPELLQMLKDGEIDLLGDVSFTEERTDYMLFASLPMGSESYHIFIAPDNEDISSDDYATLNGRRIGINRGSVQKGMFLDWARAHGITAEIVDLTGNEIDSMKLLRRGSSTPL